MLFTDKSKLELPATQVFLIVNKAQNNWLIVTNRKQGRLVCFTRHLKTAIQTPQFGIIVSKY